MKRIGKGDPADICASVQERDKERKDEIMDPMSWRGHATTNKREPRCD